MYYQTDFNEEKITHHTHAYKYTHTHKHTYTNNKRREETRGTMAAAAASTDNYNARRSTKYCCGNEATADDGGRAAA